MKGFIFVLKRYFLGDLKLFKTWFELTHLVTLYVENKVFYLSIALKKSFEIVLFPLPEAEINDDMFVFIILLEVF